MTDEQRREPLSPHRVLQGALDLADATGVEALTIRKLAASLNVKPMTIYHHVSGKEAIIDGIVDLVFAEIDLPQGHPWTAAMRHRCRSARQVLRRHWWAAPLMESRSSPGPATLRHHDAVIACLRSGGLTIPMTAHAYAIIDSYVYGFALQEASLPFGGQQEIGGVAEQILDSFPDGAYPHFVELTAGYVLRPGYSFGDSFELGLDVILDGLDRAARTR